jgi:hypothetical protein
LYVRLIALAQEHEVIVLASTASDDDDDDDVRHCLLVVVVCEKKRRRRYTRPVQKKRAKLETVEFIRPATAGEKLKRLHVTTRTIIRIG